MKGIILAAGAGMRLRPLTAAIPKPLLPVKSRFLIDYSFDVLAAMGVSEVCVVVAPEHASLFAAGLNDSNFDISYKIQRYRQGTAAIGFCERWANKDSIALIFADTIFDVERPIEPFAGNARCFSYEIDNPYWCGCVERDAAGNIENIVEKPGLGYTKSKEVIIGAYMYDDSVWDRIRSLKPSARGELEVTDLNMTYLRDGLLSVVPFPGKWHDAGTDLESYCQAWTKV